jgi:nucleoside-diphosphate-sugar epimerase
MIKKKIFITGGSGFLGSAVIANLINREYEILAAKRIDTNLYRCLKFQNKIQWVDVDDNSFIQEVVAFNPEIILHSAWTGVSSIERQDWNLQMKNFELLNKILEIGKQIKLKKILVLGSQAEYGNINQKVDEFYTNNANDAYSACKLASQLIIKTFCDQYNINWYWLRVFSVFGPGEAENWFIPLIIIKQLNNEDMDLTACEQRYDYLYIDDFAAMVTKVVASDYAPSGIYNICSGQSTSLKTIVEIIMEHISSKGKLKIGVLPYRPNQSMEITGSNDKYNVTFEPVEKTLLSNAISNTIAYYKNRSHIKLSV